MTERFGSPVLPALRVDDAHLIHEAICRQMGPALGYLWIVERQVTKLLLAVPPRQLADLCRANPTCAVIDHHIGVGPPVGAGQGGCG